MVAATLRNWRKRARGDRSLDGASHLHRQGGGKDGTHRMHETQAQAPLVQVGKLRPRAWQLMHPGQRDPGRLVSIPLYLALEVLSGASVLLGQQEGAGVTCEQATDPLLVVCEVGKVIPPSVGAVGLNKMMYVKPPAPTGSQPLRKSQLSGLPLV